MRHRDYSFCVSVSSINQSHHWVGQGANVRGFMQMFKFFLPIILHYEVAGVEVWNFLDLKMHGCAVVEDSASMQRLSLIKSLLPTKNNRLTNYFQILILMTEQTLSVTV